MKIGIASDTHGNNTMLENCVDWMIKKHKISELYHLGDDYDDVIPLGSRFLEIIQVPGIYDERYKSGMLPPKISKTVLGLSILLVHSLDKDLEKRDLLNADIILYGHTHVAEIKLSEGKLYFNPGHLKGLRDKNMAPSFGMLNIADQTVTAEIYGVDFKLLREMGLLRSESGLYK